MLEDYLCLLMIPGRPITMPQGTVTFSSEDERRPTGSALSESRVFAQTNTTHGYCVQQMLTGVLDRFLSLQVHVGALVQGVLDISAASPRRYFFEVLQHFSTSELEVDRLEYFATPAGRDDLYTYNQKEGLLLGARVWMKQRSSNCLAVWLEQQPQFHPADLFFVLQVPCLA